MTTRKAPEKINRLHHKQFWMLTTLVQNEYTQRGTMDVEFAKHATETLGFEVTSANVAASRDTLGIQSTRALAIERNRAVRVVDKLDLKARMDALEARFERLEQQVQVYIDGCTKDRRERSKERT